jgi:2-keto-4-pentenoate hydratase/2-oxohepta-3-ene-1,7-dioic acid hydratase in catechol pathway
MRLVRFQTASRIQFGALAGDVIFPVDADTLVTALQTAPQATGLALELQNLRTPVARPGKILGIGVNYAAHAAESVSFVASAPADVQKWFNKQATAINHPFGTVDLPHVSNQLDYEAELVVIVGRSGRHVPRSRAAEIIAGVCCGADFSVRDWQRASPTMIMGKGFDTHAPIGPALVTLDELGGLDGLKSLEIRGFVNGELRQKAVLGDMIHDIAAQIEHLTAAFTLEPGDLLFTGTPAGVGAGFTPPKFLVAGDRFRVEIDRIGAIENEIVREHGHCRIT